MNNDGKVYIVDDTKEVLEAMTLLMSSVGLAVETFLSANDFLEAWQDDISGCILLDVRMPGMSGLDLQKILKQKDYCPPIIIITGHGDISMAVKAVQDGAADFIEKPFNEQTLLDSVHRALELDVKNRGKSSRVNEILKKIERLTPREKDVMQLVIEGKRNKIIADALNISVSTVEVHRARVMEKLSAESLSDLMRMVILVEESPA